MSERAPAPRAMIAERVFVDEQTWDEAWRAAQACAPEAVAIEARVPDPRAALVEIVRSFGGAGLLALVARAADGGARDEVSCAALCLARERLSYASPLADLAFAMQALGSYAIGLRGDAALRAEWLGRVVSGETVAAFALTEPEAGSDLGGIATRARKDGGDYVIDGEKVLISNAGIAGLYTLFAATADEGKHRLSAFALPGDARGLRAEASDVLGGHPIGTLVLDGVRIPARCRIGDEGEGLTIALATLGVLRPTVGAAAIGMARRALDEARAHAAARRQFGAPLADQQAVQLALAEMATETHSARLVVYHAATVADDASRSRGEKRLAASMAKLHATETAQRVIDRAVQLHGGRGVLRGSVVARLYEDVRAMRIYEGASDIQKMLIARELLAE